MRIVHAFIEPLSLELISPLMTAHGTVTRRVGFVLGLEDEQGARGLGEAMPLPEFGTESLEACERALRESVGFLTQHKTLPGTTLESLGPVLSALPRNAPAARHAVELALLDLCSRDAGVALFRWLSPGATEPRVRVNALILGDTPEALAEAATSASEQGFDTVKVKVGAATLEEDLLRIAAVRRARPGLNLRVDANGAWSEEQAREALQRFSDLRLELCEQPVAPAEVDALLRLSGIGSCVIAADEALGVPGNAERILSGTPSIGALVLKPMVLGGLLPALELGRRAAARGISSYVTSSLDGPIARTGAAHLAAALPPGPHASGLAVGSLFRGEDRGPRVERGFITVSSRPGTGVTA